MYKARLTSDLSHIFETAFSGVVGFGGKKTVSLLAP